MNMPSSFSSPNSTRRKASEAFDSLVEALDDIFEWEHVTEVFRWIKGWIDPAECAMPGKAFLKCEYLCFPAKSVVG